MRKKNLPHARGETYALQSNHSEKKYAYRCNWRFDSLNVEDILQRAHKVDFFPTKKEKSDLRADNCLSLIGKETPIAYTLQGMINIF